MTTFDLRPLSLGEILDRTFSIYRSNFFLFVGIAGIPRALVLVVNLARIYFLPPITGGFGRESIANGMMGLILSAVLIVVAMIAYLLSQGAAIRALTDLYMGRSTSLQQSLIFASGKMGTLLGVAILNGLAIGGASLFLLIPGAYVLSRLVVCVPAALTESLGPSGSLSRSWHLTKGFAGRGFMIFFLYFIILFALGLLFTVPAGIAIATRNDLLRVWLALTTIGETIVAVLVNPVLLIATTLFYFDLRVRKEAFDLQLMMNPDAERFASPPPGAPFIPS